MAPTIINYGASSSSDGLCIIVLAPDSPLVGTSPAAMVGLMGVAGPVVYMHERRSIIPLHKQLCMATTTSAWRMVGTKKQLHDNLCMTISGGEGGPCGCAPVWSPINVDPWLYLRGTVNIVVSLSHEELRSYLLPQVKIGSYRMHPSWKQKLGNDGSKNGNEKLEPKTLFLQL
ncbi:unnamed protein product [Sphenostylis stenocarpa]|uniref:Uncharacterized protein n=1 Tax=Sphenostylis stenocarpa TaxID=92480 RepID=A0AA86SAQ9_9FABA|nr:unnamed protein product [Sphenostylis stenocarpa]